MIDNKYIIKNFIGIGGSSRVFACVNLEGKRLRNLNLSKDQVILVLEIG